MGLESDTSVAGTVIGLLILLSLLIILVLPVYLLSRLTKIEYDNFHDQWEKDGRPHGMPFWFPIKETSLLGLGSDPWRLGYSWLFKTPEWIMKHTTATKILRYYRIVSYFTYIGFFLFCLLLLFFTQW